MNEMQKVLDDLKEAKELIYKAHFNGWGYVSMRIMDAIQTISKYTQEEEEPDAADNDDDDRCSCWHEQYGSTYCYGTKECEPCNCGGKKSLCDFYPQNRAGNDREIKNKWVYDRPGHWRCSECGYMEGRAAETGYRKFCPVCGAAKTGTVRTDTTEKGQLMKTLDVLCEVQDRMLGGEWEEKYIDAVDAGIDAIIEKYSAINTEEENG